MICREFPVRAYFFPDTAYGCIEAPQENPLAEIAAAEHWLSTQGCSKVYGPLGQSTWYSYRATLGPYERPLFYGETNFSADPWLQSGYKIVAKYQSNIADNQTQIASRENQNATLFSQGWSVEDLTQLQRKKALLNCHQISQNAFARAFLYRDISEPDFISMYKHTRSN